MDSEPEDDVDEEPLEEIEDEEIEEDMEEELTEHTMGQPGRKWTAEEEAVVHRHIRLHPDKIDCEWDNNNFQTIMRNRGIKAV